MLPSLKHEWVFTTRGALVATAVLNVESNHGIDIQMVHDGMTILSAVVDLNSDPFSSKH